MEFFHPPDKPVEGMFPLIEKHGVGIYDIRFRLVTTAPIDGDCTGPETLEELLRHVSGVIRVFRADIKIESPEHFCFVVVIPGSQHIGIV